MKLRNKKTGEIIDIDIIENRKDGSWEWQAGKILHDLAENWEDYKPAEPLIKLEGVREAIRAWADVQGIKEVKYTEGIASSDFRYMFEYGGRGANRGIIHWGHGILLSGLEDGKSYTIEELCGEGE